MARPSSKLMQFGQFVLDRKLAEGGMAEVFLARQHGLGGFEKQVVVKRILPALSGDQAFVSMFLNEARLAAKLSHSNVVTVIEAGEVDGQYYIAMEYIDGADLRLFYEDAERTGKPTPPGIACRVIADLLGGLHYAHTRTDEAGRPLGIVHRDVTPQNVLVTRTGTVKIVDFGIAKATRAASEQTRAGTVKGKIAYLSPEQAMGKPLDARSDVFACGILLWELVTGTRLFSRPHDMASIMAITDDDIPMPSSVRPDLPEALDRLMAQALARPLVERFPNAQEMQRDLEALITSQGWAGDRRTLERHMQSRIGMQSAQFEAQAMEPVRDLEDKKASSFADGPTMLADSDPSVRLPQGAPPSKAPTVSAASDKATMALDPSLAGQRAPVQRDPARSSGDRIPSMAPRPADNPARTPSGMRAAPPVAQATPSSGQRIPAQHARTPSGMRSMPPTPGPSYPQYAQPRYEQPFDGPTQSPGRSGLRRLFLVLFIAAMVSVGTIFAVDWHPTTNTAVSLAGARLLVEVTEPATIDVDGHRTRIESTGEIAIATGKQLQLIATTLRGKGKEASRTIAVPPATQGEKISLTITFPE